jgi:RNA polymerase sigma-70 factor (ECF subfamily)
LSSKFELPVADRAFTMTKTDADFDALMRQVLAGSEDAAKELFRNYEPTLLHAIRRRLNKKIRSKFDSVDFAQDVWASFFAEEPSKRVFESPDHLVAFLTALAQNKVTDETRKHFRTIKYNVEREQSMDDSQAFDREEIVGNQPTPSQIVMSHEEWRVFLRKQPLVYRRIFTMYRDGKTEGQIATELGIADRTVRRVMERLIPGLTS